MIETRPTPAKDDHRPMVGVTNEDIAFYDGSCGLCHACVKFILRHETPESARPYFAPLFGETFERFVRPKLGGEMADSLHVLTSDGRVLIRSRANMRLARCLGGVWAKLAAIASWCPTFLLDLVYRCVAGSRKILFKTTESACPIVPQELRWRFLP